jgi:hypothetical protein
MSSSKRGRRRVGTVYLLHFERPYYHARHYLGFTTRIKGRLSEHLRGDGSGLVRAVAQAGIEIFVARTWENVTPSFERRGHHCWLGRRHVCPICQGPSAYRYLLPRPDEIGP